MQLISQYKGLRKEIYVLFFGRIVTCLGSMVWPMLTLILSRKMGMNATEVATTTIISGLLYLPASIIGGKLADKYNRKNIIVIFDLISIIFYIIASIIPLSLITIALLMIAAACQSLEYPSYNALIADLSLSKDREKAYSLSYLAMNIGLVASPTIAGLLFENYLWVSFLASGLSIGTSTLLIFFLIKDITPVQDDSEMAQYQESKTNESLLTILKENKLIIIYALVMTLYWGAYGQYNYLMPLDMGAIHGDQGAVIYGSISSLNCITVVIFTPILTRLFSKLFSTNKCTLGIILLMTGYCLFLTNRGRIPAYYLAIFLFTLGEIMTTLVEGPYLSQRIPASHRGRINGLMTVSQSILQGAMSLFIGFTYDNISPQASWISVLSILLIALVLSRVLAAKDKQAYPALYKD